MDGKFRKLLFLTLLMLIYTQTGFGRDPVLVCVSVVPQKYFVEKIGKDLVDVKVMVQPGASPATYEPKPRQMTDLSATKAYFSVGVPFEKAWLNKIMATNPQMKVFHTDQGIEKLPMAAHHHDHEHQDDHGIQHDKKHDDDHFHEHGGLDPHIWLSPPLVKIQATNILKGLQEIDPFHKAIYEANFQAFMSEIDALDAQLKMIFAGKQGLRFMVFHPSWGYFAHAYGIKQIPIEIEGKSPKPNQLKELIQFARQQNIKVIFVQPQFSTKSATLIAREINGQVVFANPLAEDWMTNLKKVADKFKAALK